MELQEFPNLYLGKKEELKEMAYKILKPWLQKLLLHLILKPPNRVTEWSDEHQAWIIKERGKALKNSPTYTPHAPTDMEIKLGPATVQHKGDLIPPFLSPHTAHSEAESLLTGLSDIDTLTHNEHLQDLVLTSHDSVVVGHCTDDSRFRRTDLMLLKMGLVTPKCLVLLQLKKPLF